MLIQKPQVKLKIKLSILTLSLFFLCLALFAKHCLDSPFLCLPMSWLQLLYLTVTYVSHHQPHRPTFKTTASTVPHHFHLLVHWVYVCAGCIQHTAAKKAVETLIASSHRKEAGELDTSWRC